MKAILLTFICLSIILPVFSQPEPPQAGYIITKNSDTVLGNIEIVRRPSHMMKIGFYNLIEKKTYTYKADRIKGFGFDSIFFESLPLNEMHFFFKRIVKGRVSLYVSEYSGWTGGAGTTAGGIFTILATGKSSSPKNITEYFVLNNSTLINVMKSNFRKTILKLVEDCPVLVAKIDREELKFENLKQIIEEYNLCNR